jgi:hypothetical protein
MKEAQEYFEKIKEMIVELSKQNDKDALKVLRDMVEFKTDYNSEPELERLRDIFYFLSGILFEKKISKRWNGT